MRGCQDGLDVVRRAEMFVDGEVVGEVVPETGGGFGQGGFGGDGGGEGFVVDDDAFGGVLGLGLGFGDDDGDRFADEAGAGVRQGPHQAVADEGAALAEGGLGDVVGVGGVGDVADGLMAVRFVVRGGQYG